MSSVKKPLPRPALGLCAALLVTLPGMAAAMQAGKAPRAGLKPIKTASGKLTGQQVYAQQCAGCHGAKGEGSKAYKKPLMGDKSIGQLARYISQAMPPGPGKKCSVPDSEKVSAYLHAEFYSPLAQARNRPARVELSRLTVKQFRNATADLIASFRPTARPAAGQDERQGLRGRYYKTRRQRPMDQALDRVDPQISFDFGQTAPDPQLDPYLFSMRWEGSVIAPESGEYEIIVKTEHASRLWINDMATPLIDALVKSGSDNEYRASLHLLAGRAYPLRLEFSKSTQGVDNPEELKKKPVTKASLFLEWKLPHRAAQVISARHLRPVQVPETYVVATPFPPDDRSIGYERGSSISKEWDEATTEAAFETAAYVASHLRELSGAADAAPDRPARLREFCRKFVESAFRRPLTPELEQVFLDRQFASVTDPELAVRKVVLLALKSPRFLYREAGTSAADPYDVASRLSFGLWDSLPDADLLKAAAAGQLSTPEQVKAQAERMVADPRARAKMADFFAQWLRVDHAPDLAKDAKRFPGFTPEIQNDLRTSLELMVEEIVWGEKSDYRELLTAEKVHLNGRLAKFYGVELPADAPFQPVALNAQERAGVLTHPFLMAGFSYVESTSPIHRGVLVARSLLGRTLQPPPEAVAPAAADLHPSLTTRQRIALQTKPVACMSCHDMINPLGFTLEKFDPVGRLREQENGAPVDATGQYETRDGKVTKFAGARDLARYVAGSEEAHSAFVTQLFEHLVKQPVRAYGTDTETRLRQSFTTNGYSIRRQMVETMVLAALKS